MTIASGAGILVLAAAALACSQRVTPEDEYAREERERRPLPAGAPAQAPAPAAEASIRGTIEGPPASNGVVFVVVRPVDASGGPPLAVRRLEPAFPLAFEIGPADAMLPGTAFPESVRLEARLDRDGDPLTRGPDDWSAAAGPVAPGADGVLLRLSPGPEPGG